MKRVKLLEEQQQYDRRMEKIYSFMSKVLFISVFISLSIVW